jgi:uncharacterized heparinase superfamily protein
MSGADRRQGAFAAWLSRLANRRAARRAARVAPASGFASQPEPRSLGLAARGRQLAAGHFLMAGRLVEAPGASLWTLHPADPLFVAEAQGFHWLDDLAALGDRAARERAQAWTWDWIARHGRGRGPGWTPDLAGRRVLRWTHHALFLLNGADAGQARAFFAAAAAQVEFLARRWPAAAPGLARIEALAGLVYAGLALGGQAHHAGAAAAALARECATEIDPAGGIATRNPEDLLEVLTLLTWAAQALSESGRGVPAELAAAIRRIAPCLRVLRHADGGLARFHGGGRGAEGRLDQALAAAGVKGAAGQGPAMGYLRLAGGRSSVIIDTGDPPAGAAGRSAHASTLAFELTSGRRPVVVSCGPGAAFGGVWRQAGRATVSHSTLALEGYSSSRFGRGQGEALAERAHVLLARHAADTGGQSVTLAHDGWSRTHGLTHGRQLWLSTDGRRLAGQDTLGPVTEAERSRFAAERARRGGEDLRFAIRFHLHPDVEASLDMNGSAVSLALRSGEIWVFRPMEPAGLSLEASAYLERGRLNPRPCRQIVLAGRLGAAETVVGWTLAKAQDTPLAIRDLERDPGS